jgi:hypothetical protein
MASISANNFLILVSIVGAVSAIVSLYLRRYKPLDRIAQFRVRKAENVQFEKMLYASIGDSPTHHQWFRGTLSFALDLDWVYLKHPRFLRSPLIWRLPRNQIRLHEHKDWDIRINAADPPLSAFFGSDFVAALRRSNRKG